LPFLVAVSRCHSLSSAAAVVPIYCLLPTPPPLLSAFAVPLVTVAVTRQLLSLDYTTVTRSRNDDLLGQIGWRWRPLSCFPHYLSPATGTPTAAVTTALSPLDCAFVVAVCAVHTRGSGFETQQSNSKKQRQRLAAAAVAAVEMAATAQCSSGSGSGSGSGGSGGGGGSGSGGGSSGSAAQRRHWQRHWQRQCNGGGSDRAAAAVAAEVAVAVAAQRRQRIGSAAAAEVAAEVAAAIAAKGAEAAAAAAWAGAAEATVAEVGVARETEKWRWRQQRQWNGRWSNTTINHQKPNIWMADGSTKQNRLTLFPLPTAATHKHPDKRCDWTELRMDGSIRLTVHRIQWTDAAAGAMGVGGRRDGRSQRRWHNHGGHRNGGGGAMEGETAARSRCAA
jgi:uncharacterized membrane protein YgcG